MKNSFKFPLLVCMLAITCALLSWNYYNNSGAPHTAVSGLITSDNGDSYYQDMVTGEGIAGSLNYAALYGEMPAKGKYRPSARDVLVKKIQGDNNHFLMIAVYDLDNLPGKTFSTTSGNQTVTFRDDGFGYDKTAGDGRFTARVEADVNQFRQIALSYAEEMRKAKNPYRFEGRSMILDPDLSNYTFDTKKLDANMEVSIANLTAKGQANDTIEALKAKSVFITELSVVEDPTRTWNPCTQSGNLDGAWSFKTLMKNLSQRDVGVPPTDAELSDFTKNWLNNWNVQKIINGDTVKARPQVRAKLLKPWQDKSKAAGALNNQLDYRFAPFKLLAIVNRFDLREQVIPGTLVAGEVRMIFGVIDSGCTQKEDMSVIMEYRVVKNGACDSLKEWAGFWYALKDLTVGTEQYNAQLQSITDRATKFGSNPFANNKSALNALRTNDVAFSEEPRTYEFREFHFGPSGNLIETPTNFVPADKYNAQVQNADVMRLANFINHNKQAIIAFSFILPDSLDGVPFKAGAAHILGPPVGNPPNEYHWDGYPVKKQDGYIKSTNARHSFSLNACTGCHAGEVQTLFFHVQPAFFGTQTTLSGFLNGRADQPGAIDFDNNYGNDSFIVRDAALRPNANKPQDRFFNDMLRRARDIKDVWFTPCGSLLAFRNDLMFKPLGMEH